MTSLAPRSGVDELRIERRVDDAQERRLRMPVNPQDFPDFPPEIIEEMRRAEAEGSASFSKSYKVTRVTKHVTDHVTDHVIDRVLDPASDRLPNQRPGASRGAGSTSDLRIEIDVNGRKQVFTRLEDVPPEHRAGLERFMADLGPDAAALPALSREVAHEEAPLAPDLHLDAATSAALVTLVRAGRKIEAIKLLRERTGLGLAEAKRAIDAMEVSVTGKKSSGCLGLLLLPLAAGALFLIL